ncbi:MAG TPA: methyltransferase domain-containing protein [Anaerolineales bacterium]|jgi:ubiquinone/menaquinone biosynthesis C-methylase UbiE
MDWHSRYLQQARWTAQLRAYLFKKAGLDVTSRVLELGCGTGALLIDFPQQNALYGLDINLAALEQVEGHAPNAHLTCGDASDLPFASSAFDLTFCHFLLLWVADPQRVVDEMCRITRPGGSVLALAEPDYGGRIDYPVELAEAGRWQVQSLRMQGAEPEMGRRLAEIFTRAGLRQVETGVLGGEWKQGQFQSENDLEWLVLAEDLAGKVPHQSLQSLRNLDALSRERGERVLYVPTFFAWGVV